MTPDELWTVIERTKIKIYQLKAEIEQATTHQERHR